MAPRVQKVVSIMLERDLLQGSDVATNSLMVINGQEVETFDFSSEGNLGFGDTFKQQWGE